MLGSWNVMFEGCSLLESCVLKSVSGKVDAELGNPRG